MASKKFKRQWRFYETQGGAKTVRNELDKLSDDDAAEVLAEMKMIEQQGLKNGGARHLRGDIWEVRASGRDIIVRALFAKEGRYGQVLLALVVFTKKTQKTPPSKIDLAETRLKSWQKRSK